MTPHVFRCFIDTPCALKQSVNLSKREQDHLAILRKKNGDTIELVDSESCVWLATLKDSKSVFIIDKVDDSKLPVSIELIAGFLSGSAFDVLVDMSVQAGVAKITPFVKTSKEYDRITHRRNRLQKIAWSAAKQSKRRFVPNISEAIYENDLRKIDNGILLDPASTQSLNEIDLLKYIKSSNVIRIFIGSADGVDSKLSENLLNSGWKTAKLGESILRSELAAAVAVSITAMRSYT